jgi:hypothetical protein
MKHLERLLVLAICWVWGAGAAHACRCDPISPEAGFDRAQYVFAGKVVQAENHAWLIEVERVWKGHERLARPRHDAAHVRQDRRVLRRADARNGEGQHALLPG